jgi:hypothetical protein
MFFSQPTHVFLCRLPPVTMPDGTFVALGASETRFFPSTSACVARCQEETRFVLDEDACARGDLVHGLAPPVQCGHVARLDATGRFLCDTHYHKAWDCVWCEAPLPAAEAQLLTGDGWAYCSPTCQAAGEAINEEGDG